MIPFKQVVSSNIDATAYDPKLEVLAVRFLRAPTVYLYTGVSADEDDALHRADSKGRHFHAAIRSKKRCFKLEEVGGRVFAGFPAARTNMPGLVARLFTDPIDERDDPELDPRFDLARRHAPGLTWGTGGPGDAQCALALAASALEDGDAALRLYERFAAEVISQLPADLPWVMSAAAVRHCAERWT